MGRGGDMGRRYGGQVRRMLRGSGLRQRPDGALTGPPQRRPRPRARLVVILIVLVAALSAVLAGGAQARKTGEQRVIVKLSCKKVTFLFLGFPEGVTNAVHEKVKVAGKVINNFKNATDFYGSIAENAV